MYNKDKIRNFCIIAHIDHGKSTLADRLLEATKTISERKMVDQVLDSMELERERGITIKAQAVRMIYERQDGEQYVFNLIDTPGHVDFAYEVSRSLAACEGAILVVDAVQGIEAQTIANAYLAIEANLHIIPVINKIDLPEARIEEVKIEIESILGFASKDVMLISAKTGENIDMVLQRIADEIPFPSGEISKDLRALIFDSVYDPYRGVIAFVRVVDGKMCGNDKICMMASSVNSQAEEVGVLAPEKQEVKCLSAGEVGYVIVGHKDIHGIPHGDTITHQKNKATQPLSGYKQMKPMVFAGLYPLEGGDYSELRESLEKLRLNDPAFNYEPESSKALGFGFRCGFLGLLHMDIIKERLEREYGQSLLITTPSVRYKVNTTDGSTVEISNPVDMPPAGNIQKIFEPHVRATIITPSEYIGQVMELCTSKRGIFKQIEYIQDNRAQLIFELPLAEILLNFFGALKATTRGYASFDYESIPYKEADLARLDILISGEHVDALSCIAPKESAYSRGRALVEQLKEVIPRQMFEVAIQAAIGSKIIARETVKAKRKDVIAKCYGGDITRKRKLLEKQKEGKKKMKKFGRVSIPQEAFLAVMQVKEK